MGDRPEVPYGHQGGQCQLGPNSKGLDVLSNQDRMGGWRHPGAQAQGLPEGASGNTNKFTNGDRLFQNDL